MVRLLLLALALTACDDPPCRDMTRSEEGLVVTESEHPSGWGESHCDGCHQRQTLHRRSCTPGVDLAAIRDDVDADASVEICASCHGDNGGFE